MSICPECNTEFPEKQGKKWCSDSCRKRVAGRKYDRKRLPQQIEKGTQFRLQNPTYDRDRMRKNRELYGRNEGIYAQLIEDAFDPITFESEACIVASDWHIPFHHSGYEDWVIDTAKQYGVKDLAIAGDLFDADSYSLWPKDGFRVAFDKELEAVGTVLARLSHVFERIFICRGNHEQRVIKQNNDNIRMQGLMDLCHASNNVEATNDTYLNMTTPSGTEWMFVHPKQFRQTPLSVARDLAAKYHKNIISAHGHFYGQGYDRSGRYYCLDGGGIFDPACLPYLRSVNTTPWVAQGFYLIDDSGYIPFSLGTEYVTLKKPPKAPLETTSQAEYDEYYPGG